MCVFGTEYNQRGTFEVMVSQIQGSFSIQGFRPKIRSHLHQIAHYIDMSRPHCFMQNLVESRGQKE